MLKNFDGAISLESLKSFSYKDTIKFFNDCIEIAQHLQKEHNNLIAQQERVKKLSNKL